MTAITLHLTATRSRENAGEPGVVYSLIEAIIFTGDALRRALAVAALRVALGVAAVQYPPGGVQRAVHLRGRRPQGRIVGGRRRDVAGQPVRQQRRRRAVQGGHGCLYVRRGAGVQALVVLKGRRRKEVAVARIVQLYRRYVYCERITRGGVCGMYRVKVPVAQPDRVRRRAVEDQLPLLQDTCKQRRRGGAELWHGKTEVGCARRLEARGRSERAA